MWVSTCLMMVLAVVPQTLASVCPESCICTTTRDGLHRAACSDMSQLYKFTLQQKHHNINILDLSHNNITKLNHELDRLTEVVTLDLSTNGIAELNKFLRNAKKLVHLNLANNRIKELSLLHLPPSVSSLDLTHNLLTNVPSEIKHLKSLEHLELEGNPLKCSCENIMERDYMLKSNIFIDDVECSEPYNLKGKSWLQLKTKDICKSSQQDFSGLDIMMGDQPLDAVQVGEETTALKSMPLAAKSDLEDGSVHSNDHVEDDDSLVFMAVNKHKTSVPVNLLEGSGDVESTTYENTIESDQNDDLIGSRMEGSGDLYEGSGSGMFDETFLVETTTPGSLYTGPVMPYFTEDGSLEFTPPKSPTVYAGGPDWHKESSVSEEPEISKSHSIQEATTPMVRDTTISEQIRVTQASNLNEMPSATTSHPTTHKTGTYVCIAIIVILLVTLIGFAIIKGQIRKRRDRRMLRQQKRDIEKASKEMVDMNKSLLGKPAVNDIPLEKKINGKYELVPTHEPIQKKNGNVEHGNGVNHSDNNGVRHESPRDSNQNKNSSKNNYATDDIDSRPPVQETSFESSPNSQDSKKDTHSLSSDDIFMPLNDEDKMSVPKLNGFTDRDASSPLINGKPTTISDLLAPREYVPVYSPDMGRVRIKLSETPKPKTPVLVTRSRSNAGDIIITPTLDGTLPDSTT